MSKLWNWFIGVEPESAPEKKSALGDLIRESGSGKTSVTLASAIQVSTVLACARVIAEGLAQVPCKLLRDAKDGGKEEARDHPLFMLLHREPNEFQTGFEFREMVGLHAVLTGNAYIFINRDSKGRPIELLPYEPGAVEVKREGFDQPRYLVKVKGTKIEVAASNMWHLKGPSMNGHLGLDPVKEARQAIGLAMATEGYGKKLFDNNSMPSGLLSTDASLTAEQMETLRNAWVASLSNGNQLGTAVLSNGLKFSPLSVTPENAQFLETRRHQIEEICRIFKVNPIKVFSNENATSYSSLEQLNMAHLSDTLAPWFERFEQSAEKALLSDKEKAAGYQIKLNTRGLLKASANERASYYNTMRAAGLMTINECRAAEDMPRIDDELADKITPAANLFGAQPQPQQTSTGEPKENE